MRYLAILFILGSNCCLAQPSVMQEIGMLISPETMDLASEKVEEYLAADPNNVDALVMKGNVIYYNYNYSQPLELHTNDNESIYDRSIGLMGEPATVVPENIADSVITIWLQAVGIDSTRDDVHMGICHLYSISLQADKLIEYMPTLLAYTNGQLDAYKMENYARNFLDRDAIDEGMAVYLAIAELFPDDAGVYSDMAGEYYALGNMDKAMEYVDLSMQHEKADDIAYGNAFFLYSVNGEYDKALEAHKTMCLLQGNEVNPTLDYMLYDGLVRLASGDESGKDILQSYLDSADGMGPEQKLAQIMLKENASYTEAVNVQLHDGYKLLVNDYFRKQGNDFMPAFNYAEILTYNHRYEAAVQAFNEIDTTGLSQREMEDIYLYRGWSLYETNQLEKANEDWFKLLGSDQFYYQSAAAWFLGSYCLQMGNKTEASEYFNLVAGNSSRSKYATMCWNALNELEE